MSMEQFNRLAAPATAQFRKLQKIVQDINKNDGGLLNKLMRLKDKPRPKVPERDYPGEHVEDNEWSEESDEYEEPHEDNSGYEPPPAQRVFTPSSSSPFSREDYIDSCRHRGNQAARKPPHPARATKPLPPRPQQMASDEEDYINPEEGNQGNYIQPTEKPPLSVTSSHAVSKPQWKLPRHPVGHKGSLPVESNSSGNRFSPNTQTHSLPPNVSPRLIRPHIPEPTLETEYEVCDPDDSPTERKARNPIALPKPLPREKPPTPVLRTRPIMPPERPRGKTLPTMSSEPQLPPHKGMTADFGRPMIPCPQMLKSHRQADLSSVVENGFQDKDKESDIYRQPWFANTCGRKAAEEVLIQSNRDGSFLVRESSGQDAEQPYTLAVFYSGKVYNIPVRFIQATQQYALGREKKGEEHFPSVSRIIDNHLKNPLVLIDSQSNTRDTTKLQHPVRP